MSAAAETGFGGRAGVVLRWAFCFGLVLIVHVGVALFLLDHPLQSDEQPAGAPPDAIMLDLAPEATTPSPGPTPEPQPAPEPPPEPPPLARPHEPAPVAPPQMSVPALPEPPPSAPPPPRPVVRPTPPRAVPPRRSEPRQETAREPRPDQTSAPAAPASGPAPLAPTSAPPSLGAVAGWRNALIQRLQQAKRYPEAARAHNEQGVATISFTMDRDGHILSVRLVHGSGSDALDQEAVAMIHRADPLPALPAGIEASSLTLTVPVTFSLR